MLATRHVLGLNSAAIRYPFQFPLDVHALLSTYIYIYLPISSYIQICIHGFVWTYGTPKPAESSFSLVKWPFGCIPIFRHTHSHLVYIYVYMMCIYIYIYVYDVYIYMYNIEICIFQFWVLIIIPKDPLFTSAGQRSQGLPSQWQLRGHDTSSRGARSLLSGNGPQAAQPRGPRPAPLHSRAADVAKAQASNPISWQSHDSLQGAGRQ